LTRFEEGFNNSLSKLFVAGADRVEIGSPLLGQQFQCSLKDLFPALVKLAHNME
jgi:hypothetical protein